MISIKKRASRRTKTAQLTALGIVAGLGVASLAAGPAASAAEADIADRLQAIPGMSLVEEKPATDGDRFFLLDYTQPVDHRDPDGDTFEQRLSVLHTDDGRPTVFATNGYWLNPNPAYSEPTQLLDANEVGVEHRFFGTSVPDEDDWSTLDIWQAATDHHRVRQALDGVYDQSWIATGRSKSGMAAAYYNYYYPDDLDGTVAYVAPSNPDREDTGPYDEFFETVGTQECREAVERVAHTALQRRPQLLELHDRWAEANDATFDTVGSADASLEVGIVSLRFTFWSYGGGDDCLDVPEPKADAQTLFSYIEEWVGFGADFELEPTAPYYYQAGTQLGNPLFNEEYLDGMQQYPELRYSGAFVPNRIDMPEYDDSEVIAVHDWVRDEGSRMLFVNGGSDPWSAKPFQIADPEAQDAHVLTAPGANHSQAFISALSAGDRATATEALLDWAGSDAPAELVAAGAASYDASLDHPEPGRLP
ncbi:MULTISPECIES: S28 family serine protease [unclassified Streptomyces]|uniref:S28 family serine protease n=1 Tax=unclassified Streptomyces TaxID=2593676 RepID=UPI0011B03DFA|nr:MULTISPECIES: S28 family serine protease [unclassified Streptomyces]